MTTKSKNIPVNAFSTGVGTGIFVGKALFNGSSNFADVQRSHRDNAHSFILQEKGSTQIEIDFQKYDVKAPSVIYINPNQVHRVIGFKNATINSLMITNENIRPEFLNILNDITPVNPISLKTESYSILAETIALCIKLSGREAEKLHHSILKESCNTLVALVISQYLANVKPLENYSRFETVTKAFKLALEQHFTTIKSPKEYAKQLNVSAPYLNELRENCYRFFGIAPYFAAGCLGS
jgi:hypothetical protein